MQYNPHEGLTQGDDCRAPSTCFRRGVLERNHEGRSRQDFTHQLSLHPDSAAMDDPQRLQPKPVRLIQILFDDAFNVAGGTLCRSRYPQ